MKTETKKAREIKLTPQQKRWTLQLMDGKSTGEKIKIARLARGLTLSDVAAKAGIMRQNLYRMERSGRNPKLDTLKSVAKVLKFKTSELI